MKTAMLKKRKCENKINKTAYFKEHFPHMYKKKNFINNWST